MSGYCLDENDVIEYDIDIKSVIDTIKSKIGTKSVQDSDYDSAILIATENSKCSNMRLCVLNKYKQDILNSRKDEDFFRDIIVAIYNNGTKLAKATRELRVIKKPEIVEIELVEDSGLEQIGDDSLNDVELNTKKDIQTEKSEIGKVEAKEIEREKETEPIPSEDIQKIVDEKKSFKKQKEVKKTTKIKEPKNLFDF
jgi:hypothetical protein